MTLNDADTERTGGQGGRAVAPVDGAGEATLFRRRAAGEAVTHHTSSEARATPPI